jgi:hypothetical protein
MVKHLLVKNNLVKRDLDDSTNKPKVYWQTISANWHCTFMTKDTHLDQLINKYLYILSWRDGLASFGWKQFCRKTFRWQHQKTKSVLGKMAPYILDKRHLSQPIGQQETKSFFMYWVGNMVKRLLVKNNLVEKHLEGSTNKPKVYLQTISALYIYGKRHPSRLIDQQ